MPQIKLTDRQIAELYTGLAQHYQACKHLKMSTPDMYNALSRMMYYTFNILNNPLQNLPLQETQEVFNVLNTFFYATPEGRRAPEQYPNVNFFNNGSVAPNITYYHQNCSTYSHRNDNLFWDLYLIIQCNQPPQGSGYIGSGHKDSTTHGHPSNTQKNEALSFLLLLLLAAAVACCAFIAAYYMFSQSLDILERFICNEGMLQALMTALTMAVTTTASTMLANLFAASPIYALAIAAGVSNPVGWVLFSVISLGIVGGALGTFISEQVHQYIIKQTNQNAMDPEDPSRFRLTTSEVKVLLGQGIDPIKVICAMVALRAEMGCQRVPHVLNRLFSSDPKIQKNLLTIRQLRRGEIRNVVVGDMHFNCLQDALPVPVSQGQLMPSAPPYESLPPSYEESQGNRPR